MVKVFTGPHGIAREGGWAGPPRRQLFQCLGANQHHPPVCYL